MGRPRVPSIPMVVPPPEPIEPDPNQIARLLNLRELRNRGTQSLRIDPAIEPIIGDARSLFLGQQRQ